MAIRKCKECGNQVSTKAAFCPNCGAVQKKKTGCLTQIVAIFFGLFFLSIIINALSGDSSSTSSSTASSRRSSGSSSKKANVWSSHAYISDLEHKKMAHVGSKKVRSDRPMDFPYNGTTGEISVVKDNRDTWALIEFSKAPNIVGADLADGYNIIKANVYIDGVKETATLTQEWGSKTLYFKYPNWLIKKLKACKTFRINLRWHGNPEVVWSFSGANFESEYQRMLDKFKKL